MTGGRLVIPGTITNTDLPLVTENADYDAIANLPGLVHFADWVTAKVITASPLSVAEHVADVAYSRRAGYAGSTARTTLGGSDAVSCPNSGSEFTSGVTINYAADFSIAFVVERDASSSTAASFVFAAFSPGTELAQIYAATTTSTITLFSSVKTWTNSLSGTLVPGEKAVFVMAYDHGTLTLRIRKNGVSIGSAAVNSALAAGLLYFGRSFPAKFGHLFVFNVDLNEATHATTRSYVETYLAGKHGITL
jgi:hypothetical protein